jgi:VanZ family protein
VCASVSHSRLPVTRARATDATAPCCQPWAAVAGVPMMRGGICSRGGVTSHEGDTAPLDHWKSARPRCFLKQTPGAPLQRLLETPLSTLGKAVLAGCIIALAILAWTPAHSMARTALGGPAEHFVAWLGTATIVGLASRATALLAPQFLLLVLYAAILECGQFYAPGRQASLHDFAFSVGGVLLGSALVWMARRCWLRRGSRPAR